MFPCLQTNHMNVFSSSDIVNSYYMTSTIGDSFERNKESPSFRTNDDTIIVQCFFFFLIFFTQYFLIYFFFFFFLQLISSSVYLSLEICFPEICLVFCVSIFYVTLKLFSLFHFNKIYFSERSRYLFNNTYIVRSSLLILYPCR